MKFPFSFDRRYFKHFDYVILALIALLTLIGILTIMGSTVNLSRLHSFGKRQILWLGVSMVAFGFVIAVDYRVLGRFAFLFYSVINVCLVYLLIKGYAIKGSASWIAFGSVRFQPSEFAKIAVALFLATHLQDRMGKIYYLRDIFIPCLIVFFPMCLVILQPDLGSAAIFVPILLTMLFAAGMRRKLIVLMVLCGIIGVAGTYPFLKPYQKQRIIVFLNPGHDPLGKGYNLFQSQIALGSGKLTGKGWQKGTQTALQFLPEHHTDFIFSSYCEQFGVGAAFVLFLAFVILVVRSLAVALEAGDTFGALLVIGLLSIFISHLLLNIAMTVGLFPVAGVPLPFISYGGSFLLASFITFALICNVGMRKFMF